MKRKPKKSGVEMKRKPKEGGLWKELAMNPLFKEALKRQAEQDTSCALLGDATSRSMTLYCSPLVQTTC